MRRIRRALAAEGAAATLRRCARYLMNCRRYLSREPARTLGEAPIDGAFDGGRTRVAVQIHMFYPELAREMLDVTNRIPYRFDCYISTDTREKAERIRRVFDGESRAARVEIEVFPNGGRDVAPFAGQMAAHVQQYDYCCHLHTKRSAHGDDGDSWRLYLLNTLLQSPGYIAAILRAFEDDPRLGLVFQRTYPPLKPYLGWRGNRANAERLFARMGLPPPPRRDPPFPAGNMFWARMEAIRPVLECGLTQSDFPEESGQVEHTMAHCLERCWGCVAEAKGFGILRVKPLK